MLGITVADAVLVVGLAATTFAALRGVKAGGKAAREDPPPPISLGGGMLADTLGLAENTAALNRLAAAIEDGVDRLAETAAAERHREMMEALARIEPRDA